MPFQLSRRFRALTRILLFAGSTVFGLYVLSLVAVLLGFRGHAALPADCAIVFGTAVRPSFDRHGEIIYTGPGPGILRRVATAAELYRTGKVKKLFLTGGRGAGMAESEASVMQRIAVVRGVALKDIVTEQDSRSTWENVLNTLPLTEECQSVIGVSDRYHLSRIRVLSWLAGRVIDTYPASDPPNVWFEARSVLREAAGIMLTPYVILLT